MVTATAHYSESVLAKAISRAYPRASGFASKIVSVAHELGMDPFTLANLIGFESAYSFSASRQHPKSRATGLIQFMPDTAPDFNTTVEALAMMSETEQMNYVRAYLKQRTRSYGKLDTPYRVAMSVFYPEALKYESSVPFEKIITDYWVGRRGRSAEYAAAKVAKFHKQNDPIKTPADYMDFMFSRAKLPASLREYDGGVA